MTPLSWWRRRGATVARSKATRQTFPLRAQILCRHIGEVGLRPEGRSGTTQENPAGMGGLSKIATASSAQAFSSCGVRMDNQIISSADRARIDSENDHRRVTRPHLRIIVKETRGYSTGYLRGSSDTIQHGPESREVGYGFSIIMDGLWLLQQKTPLHILEH